MKLNIPTVIMLFLFVTTPLNAKDSDDWRLDKPWGRELQKLQVEKMSGVSKTFCTNIMNTQICAYQKSYETEEIDISIEYKGSIKKQWAIEMLPSLFGPSAFRLYAADLDNDSKEEILFAARSRQSNGMVVQYWPVWCLDEGHVSKPIEINDYGNMGYLTTSEYGSH